MLLKHTLDSPLCQPIARQYRFWFEFMERNVEFWMADSAWHAKDHGARVLLLALIIGHQKGLDAEGLETLCLASVFHDSRRLTDWIDKGHGERAAAYYRAFCLRRNLPVDEDAGFLMHYHDLDDAVGLAEIEKLTAGRERRLLLYQIFKDADALDRFRLGQHALDVTMLRTAETPALIAFSKYILQQSKEELNASRPSPAPDLYTPAHKE